MKPEMRDEKRQDQAIIPASARPGAYGKPYADKLGFWEYLQTHGLFIYKHPKHTHRQILSPGYFDAICAFDHRRYLGALVIYTACGGHKDPERWVTGILRVVKVRGAAGVGSEEPTLSASVVNFGVATVHTHDGELEEAA